jgi:carotenoid 1,2-hydratase
MNRFVMPERSGSYRWYYVDVSTGDYTAVFIFMLGSLFSARYSAALKKGGLPREHSAVNFALYEKGVRWQWVLTEYQAASVEDDGRTLRIGQSFLSYDGDTVRAVVKDKLAPWGGRTEAHLEFKAQTPSHDEVRLVEGQAHFWRPIAVRGAAKVTLPGHELTLEGRGYHDGNHGEVPLGSDLRGWEWVRTHRPDATSIVYRPWGTAPAISVEASAARVDVQRVVLPPPSTHRTGWGLQVPRSLGPTEAPMLLESSPFYARLESHEHETHALGEVADFARFHTPSIRWMARLRTRQGAA